MKTVAVVNAAQLVTVAGPRRPRVGAEMRELGVVANGGMLMRDGVIAEIGSSDQIGRAAGSAQVIDAAGRVVLPGFVDAHAHPVFAGDRIDEFEMRARGATYEEIAAAGGGIRSTMRKTRAATEVELEQQAFAHVQMCIACGTTTLEAKSGYGLSVEDELKMLRVIRKLGQTSGIEVVPTFLGAHAVPPECDGDVTRYAEIVMNEMLPRVVTDGLAEYCDIFCERGYFEVEIARRILKDAKRQGLQLRMHVDQLTNSGGAALAAEFGAVTADHLEQTEVEGIDHLKRGNVQPVLLPGSVYALGKTRYPRARDMIEAGLAVVLATDFNPGSSPTPSIPMVLSLAATHMKMTPAEGVTAATINAAYSLGRGERIGSLEPGKLANFSLFDCKDYREVAYWFGIPQTHSVYARGEKVFPL